MFPGIRSLSIAAVTMILLGVTLLVVAQPRGPQLLGPPTPVPDAKLALSPQVSITKRAPYRYVTSNGIPNHDPGQFPNRGNPHRIAVQNYQFRFPISPEFAPRPRDAGGMPFGVALNGVPFDPGTAELWRNNHDWRYDALSGKINLGVDSSNAHVQPSGAYHYHGLPHGLIATLGNSDQMHLLGYAADGFPIYNQYGHSDPEDNASPLKILRSGYRLRSGKRPSGADGPGGTYDGTFNQDFVHDPRIGDLDDCNGRLAVTPESSEPVYHYVITEEFPFISRLFKGNPDDSFRRRGPGGPPGRGGPPPGRRPRRGPPPPRESL